MVVRNRVTRRGVLRAVAAGGTVGAVSGTAGAASGPKPRIVGVDSPRAERAARARADSVGRVLDFGDIGRAVAGRFSDEAAEHLTNRPDVRYVEEDGTMEALAQTLPWGVDRVDADVAHANGETGGDDTDGEGGADVAVIDTGIDSDHPDLQANLGAGRAVVSSQGPYARSWDDDNGHGTHCAGIAGAVDNREGVVGVSTAATLHAVKVLDENGSGSFSDVAAGIEWVADQGYDVGSMSLGAASGSRTVEDACRYAHDRGVLLVAAAGNSGPCSDCVGYPAAYSTVMAVSSTTRSDSLSGFSSTGTEVEIAAPGSEIYSTYAGGDYDTLSGTSMACPHVAGAAGQLMDNGYSNAEARNRLSSTAEDIGLSSNQQGSGLLDVEAAIGDSGGGSDTSPAVTTDPATDVTATSATLNGTLSDLGGAASADCSFEYREAGTSGWNSAAAGTLTSTGSFGASVSGLVDGATYECRAVAAASDGDSASGSTATFTTTGEASSGPPSVSFTAAETGSPNPHAEITVDWTISDDDGDLAEIVIDVAAVDGSASDTRRYAYGGSAGDSGSDYFTFKHGGGPDYEVTVTATDGQGNSTTETETVTS